MHDLVVPPEGRIFILEGVQAVRAGGHHAEHAAEPRLRDLAAAAAGLGAVGLAVVLSRGGQPDFDHIAEADAGTAEIELFLAEDNLEMIADYDFYLWLDAEPDAG